MTRPPQRHVLIMAASFSFNFVVADDKGDCEHCDPRLPVATRSSSSSVSQDVGSQTAPAKQHHFDSQDDFYRELLCHVTLNFYQPNARKASGGLCYLKLEEIKQRFLRQTGLCRTFSRMT